MSCIKHLVPAWSGLSVQYSLLRCIIFGGQFGVSSVGSRLLELLHAPDQLPAGVVRGPAIVITEGLRKRLCGSPFGTCWRGPGYHHLEHGHLGGQKSMLTGLWVSASSCSANVSLRRGRALASLHFFIVAYTYGSTYHQEGPY